ncbi:MAG TPA: hypothetical protein VK592_04550 [Candidatus Dormibacteraeota bacterium]|nr:hypothetical protein [Candidatus Dormibacteraeota bacterium]
MTPDQVSGFFDAGESFVEGTIAAALVLLWLLVVALQLARPYMLVNLRKFTLRLGADLWWIVYVAVLNLVLINVFLGSFIFFYPDVVSGRDLPITGGLAAVCAFGALMAKLMRGDGDLTSQRVQTLLIGLGAVLYLGPYILGVQLTDVTGQHVEQLANFFTSSRNPDLALPLCYLSAALAGIMALVAVVYNWREAATRRPRPTDA